MKEGWVGKRDCGRRREGEIWMVVKNVFVCENPGRHDMRHGTERQRRGRKKLHSNFKGANNQRLVVRSLCLCRGGTLIIRMV